MQFRPRSLLSNSLSSLFASAILLLSTILIPALLARSLSRDQFDTYALVFAALPPLLILPQSLRTMGASQLSLAIERHGLSVAVWGFAKFSLLVAAIHVVIGLVGIGIYIRLSDDIVDGLMLWLGLIAVLAYTLGIAAGGYFVAPAAAHRDFIPDNVAKVWPGIFQLCGITALWLLKPGDILGWLFLIYVASSWSVATALWALTRLRGTALPTRTATPAPMLGSFARGLGGIVWWNLTAFLATSASIMVVAVMLPKEIAPFSIAVSLQGLISAVLIAVSGPIALNAASMTQGESAHRRAFFLRINTWFQAYIVLAVAGVLIVPTELFQLWLTAELGAEVRRFVILLVPATAIRLLTMCYTVFVMSAGRQHAMWLSPAVEAIFSVALSIALAKTMGADGVALALALAALVRLSLTVWHDEPCNDQALGLRRGDVLLSAWRLTRAGR